MVNRFHAAFQAYDRSYFAILKKEIHAIAVSAGLSENKVGEIDVVIAELVSNLVKHAGGGRLLVKLIKEDELQGIEIISIDDGVGMTDISKMVADGVSTKNTLGHGLGTMRRMSDTFQVYSHKTWGTVILIRIFEKSLPPFRKPPVADIKSVVTPKPGEIACGDGFYSVVNSRYIKLLLGDGLGHGIEAETAVKVAGEAFTNCLENEPPEIIRYINGHVKKTRGLVASVAVFDMDTRKWKICGVGNITTRITQADGMRNYTAYNGIVGLNVPNTLNSVEVDFEKNQHILMCSDGLKTKWDLVKYPAILRYDLSILCATLLKDQARNTDDMSIVACKINL